MVMQETPSNASTLPARVYTAREMAQIFASSERWIYLQAKLGVIPSLQIGGRVLFPIAEIDAFIGPPAGAAVSDATS